MATRSEIVEEGAAVKDRGSRRILAAILVVLIICMFLMIWSAIGVYKAVKDTADAGADLAVQVRKACADPSIDVPPEIDCGKADEVIDEAPEVIQGEPGEDGPPPSDAQVALAVANYCSDGSCDGQNATQAQVSAAVAMYCNNRGQCRGPEGEEGQDGADGEDGQDAPPPSDSQVASAVAGYCSTRNDCRGPAGEPGKPGQDGSPGDVVTGGECTFNGPGSITITIMTATGPTTFQCDGSIVPGPGDNPNGGGAGNGG